jgi:hypothetical protein
VNVKHWLLSAGGSWVSEDSLTLEQESELQISCCVAAWDVIGDQLYQAGLEKQSLGFKRDSFQVKIEPNARKPEQSYFIIDSISDLVSLALPTMGKFSTTMATFSGIKR